MLFQFINTRLECLANDRPDGAIRSYETPAIGPPSWQPYHIATFPQSIARSARSGLRRKPDISAV